jgi:hypothetical protein
LSRGFQYQHAIVIMNGGKTIEKSENLVERHEAIVAQLAEKETQIEGINLNVKLTVK